MNNITQMIYFDKYFSYTNQEWIRKFSSRSDM
jgi:hypothetical protein